MIEKNKKEAVEWFSSLQKTICKDIENYENKHGSDAKFEFKTWNRDGGGGGTMALIQGKVFEKMGVNFSEVYGTFSNDFAKEIPFSENSGLFWASGISIVAHMQSPMIPAIHMNTRFIVTEKSWFGGGIDLTPTFEDIKDTEFFHSQLKTVCDKFDSDYYPRFKKNCDDYFFLHHRKEPRGIGGIFYDYLNSNDWNKDFGFTKEVGKNFSSIFLTIVENNIKKDWTNLEKEQQLYKRGRYVEFNLLYDRGTRFGLMTGGNVDAILMSLPPEVKWK